MTVLQQFFIKNRRYFWDFADIKSVSLEKGVERILDLGSQKSVEKLCDILGKKKVARIFFEQISGKRNNYQPKIKNYFQIVLKQYV